jgi:hypothetical protein
MKANDMITETTAHPFLAAIVTTGGVTILSLINPILATLAGVGALVYWCYKIKKERIAARIEQLTLDELERKQNRHKTHGR